MNHTRDFANFSEQFLTNPDDILAKSEKNPWDIQSIYEFQYFNCPSCLFKNHSKQEFINHAFETHSEFIHNLYKINDNSLIDVVCPWNEPFTQIKIENENFENEETIKTEEIDPLDEKVHVNSVHEGLKNHNCEICGKNFALASTLKYHP